MPIYEKSVRELFKDFVLESNLSDGRRFSRNDVVAWFTDKYPKIKRSTIAAHLLMMSTNARSRIHYNPRSNGEDDLFFQLDSTHFRRYACGVDPPPLQRGDSGHVEDPAEPSEDLEGREFAYERDLKNYLAKHLSIIESGLRLYEDEGITGLEFPVGGRFIDILAVDKDGNYVVIELKVSRGYDRVVGQLLRYMAWIEQNQMERGQRVRGVIVAGDITEDLILAASRIQDVSLFKYQLAISLKRIE